MEAIKEIYESMKARISSPYFGYFVLASLAINWKPFAYLFFSEEDIVRKIANFENNTTLYSLIAVPAFYGLLIALSSPWLKAAFTWLNSFPVTYANKIQARSESSVLTEKFVLEQKRARQEALLEQSLIDRAKRDAEAKAITDAEVREKLEKDLEQQRSKEAIDVADEEKKRAVELTPQERKKLRELASHPETVSPEPEGSYRSGTQKMNDRILAKLVDKGMIEWQDNGSGYDEFITIITDKGVDYLLDH